MKFCLAVTVVIVGIGVSGLAQQKESFKVKHSTHEKTAKSTAPIAKTANSKTSSAANANARELQALERQTFKASAPTRSAGNRTAPALKPVKDKSNPPINFGGKGGSKPTGSAKQSSNPYAGRLKQKHARQ